MHELWMCTGIYRSASGIELEDAEAWSFAIKMSKRSFAGWDSARAKHKNQVDELADQTLPIVRDDSKSIRSKVDDTP